MKRTFIMCGALAAVIMGACKKRDAKDFEKVDRPLKLIKSASPVGDVVGKVTAGYQGWFTAAGDGSPQNTWGHQNLECWPSVSEYTTTYQTSYANLGNGQPARVFSSWDQSTVNKHFEWMKQYDIDCAALQRFCNEVTPGSTIKTFRDGMATRVRNAAQTYGRKFYIMYDASGWGNLAAIKTDWTNTITGTLGLLSSPAYAIQNGKPVVCIYGLGYASHPSSVADALDLINWFKTQGCYVIGSVPGQWRTGTGDSKAGFIDAYKAFNMISGWAVGRAVDATYNPWVTGDRDFCNANNMDYQPCAYPGTSFYNSNGPSSPQNQFPRNHGDFLWAQLATFKNAGVPSVYIAMFDEVNEATQIFKTAENASQRPSNQWFLTLDADGTAVSSDFYLRLTGDGGKMIKGTLPYTATHPTPHTVSGGVTFYQNTNYGGAASQVLPVGNYTLSQLAARGMPNDWASSVRVPSGRTVIMYSDDNFSGQAWTRTSDTPNFPGLSPSPN
ncbi:MAG: lectin, partial [Sphingobacteriaceae bacterium]